jgi:hypothetical protein
MLFANSFMRRIRKGTLQASIQQPLVEVSPSADSAEEVVLMIALQILLTLLMEETAVQPITHIADLEEVLAINFLEVILSDLIMNRNKSFNNSLHKKIWKDESSLEGPICQGRFADSKR